MSGFTSVDIPTLSGVFKSVYFPTALHQRKSLLSINHYLFNKVIQQGIPYEMLA